MDKKTPQPSALIARSSWLMKIRKHSVLLCIACSVILITIATWFYPVGSISDKNSIGFIWSKNFISNLFDAKAINGAPNDS